MEKPVNHAWDRHAQLRLDECASAATGVLIAVADNDAHLGTDRLAQINRAIRDLITVRTILERRIDQEEIVIRRAAA